ncbi:DUF4355 domain-containing protein [Arthrobacter sp. D3-18]
MSEESAATGGESSDFKPITTQEDFNKILGERLKRAKPSNYDDLKAKAAQFDQAQQDKLTETQRLQAQLEELSGQAKTAQRENARLAAIAAEGIPAEYQDLVHGETPEQFAASAKKAKDLISKATAAESKPGVSYRVNLDGDGSEQLALNGSGIEDALKRKLGIS